MSAFVNDFSVKNGKNGEPVFYYFRFGRCDDFTKTLERFKLAIPASKRVPQPDKNWLWRVDVDDQTTRSLCRIFVNFEECLEIVARQLRMF